MTAEPNRFSRVNWNQALAEVILILIGIALALAADSWMDDRADRREERQYLVALKGDIEKTRESLEDTITHTKRSNDITLRFIQLLQGSMDELTDEELVANIQNTF